MAAPSASPTGTRSRRSATRREPSSRGRSPRRSGGSPAACWRAAGTESSSFLDLVDRSGRLQLLCDESRTGRLDVDLGDVVGVVGSPATSRRGEPSLAVDELTSCSRRPSAAPDTFHGLTDTETRYRKRYLDLLVNEETRALFSSRARVVAAIRRHLDAAGFVEVETPILQPRYGGAFAHPFVTRSKSSTPTSTCGSRPSSTSSA